LLSYSTIDGKHERFPCNRTLAKLFELVPMNLNNKTAVMATLEEGFYRSALCQESAFFGLPRLIRLEYIEHDFCTRFRFKNPMPEASPRKPSGLIGCKLQGIERAKVARDL